MPKPHWILFEEAASTFLGPGTLMFLDPDRSEQENREITNGRSVRRRVLFAAHTARKGWGSNTPGAETV